MATKTKKAPAKKSAPKVQEPPPAVALVPYGSQPWDGPAKWTGKDLAFRLEAIELISDNWYETAANADESDPTGHTQLIERWLEQRTDAERDALAAFVLVVSWLDHVGGSGATAAQLTPPDVLLPLLGDGFQTAEGLFSHCWQEQQISEPEASIAAVEEAAAEKIANEAASEPVAENTIAEATRMVGDIAEKIVDEALSAPSVEKDGQLNAIQEPAKSKALKPMQFRSGEEVATVRRALEAELKDVEKLAKENEAAGLFDGAKEAKKRAQLIKATLIPQVSAQQDMPFENSRETLPAMVARTVAGEVRSRAKAALMNIKPILRKGEKHEDAKARQMETLDTLESLIGNIGEQVGGIVVKFLDAAADEGMTAGKAAIAANASEVARRAIQRVEFDLRQGNAA